MDCQDVRELIPDFVDEELSARLAKEVVLHTDGCSSCRRELEEARRLQRLLSGWEVPQVAPVKAAVMETRLLAELTARRRRERTVHTLQREARRLLSAAAAVTVIAAGLWCGQRLASRNNGRPLCQPVVQSASMQAKTGKPAVREQARPVTNTSRPATEKTVRRRYILHEQVAVKEEPQLARRPDGARSAVKPDGYTGTGTDNRPGVDDAETRVIAALTETTPAAAPVAVIARADTGNPEQTLVAYWTETE